MTVIDTSVWAAILLEEPDAADIVRRLAASTGSRMSAATYVEISIVTIRRLGPEALPTLQRILEGAAIDIEPLSADQARLASKAFLAYGKGRHPAALNFGDCFSYALAKDLGEPLLYKGRDFEQTDLPPSPVAGA